MKKLLTILAVLCMALLPALALADDDARTVTVCGTATIVVEADGATVSFGIETRAKEAASASEANALKTQQLKQALLGAGVEEKDITTEYYFVSPIYDYNQTNEEGMMPVTGYTVSNTLSVRLHAIDQIGALIDTALGAGATSCNGISFSSSLSASAQDDALAAAVAEGRRKAGIMAAACGGKLGQILSVTEQAGQSTGAFFNKRDAGTGAAVMEEAATEIVADGLRYSATVVMVFELKDAE